MNIDTLTISIIIVSFNTSELLQRCLEAVQQESSMINTEIIVIDNNSKDGSADVVEHKFPKVRLIRSSKNLGFAAANNLGFTYAKGDYIILLNPDAFLTPNALINAINYIDKNPTIGLAGARLIGEDGDWQPSARMFPSLLNHLLNLSGLAAKYPQSRFFGRVDYTWANHDQAMSVDWVPGAFSIIRRNVLEQIGFFDEQFFLYYEEVDLCCRIKAAGYSIWYLPDVTVVHVGGACSEALSDLTRSTKGRQVTLWQLRSALLFYRKNYGLLYTWLWMQIENNWHRIRAWKNRTNFKAEDSNNLRNLLKQAWQETQGGKISPPRPW